MALKQIRYAAYMPNPDPAGAPLELHADVILADQLRGELEGKRRHLSLEDKVHTTALWCWAALVRQGDYADKFDDFAATCIDIDAVDDPDTVPEVDPTQPAASDDSA